EGTMPVHSIHRLELRKLVDARPAPGGPEVHRSSLPVEFLRRAARSPALTGFTVTASPSMRASSALRPCSLYIHLVEQPTAGVLATGTGLSARRASIASRASRWVTSASRGLLSTRPW